MAQRTDLYSILVAYANKYNSPYIEIEVFLDFLGRCARKYSEEQPEWIKWIHERPVKFWAEMSVLIEENKCELISDTPGGRIYMPHFYIEVLKKTYQQIDEDADLPFPNEETLRITLPENQTRLLTSPADIIALLDEPQESDTPILKLNFHEEFGSTLFLATMVPRRLTEIALIKLRNYLQKGGNKDFTFHKILPQLQGKEMYVQEQFNHILIRPLDCFNTIFAGAEFSSLFWAHFSIIVRTDIRKKKERLSEDIAAFQAVSIIEVISDYYKTQALKEKEAELALKNLELHLAKPPFLYTLDHILKLTSPKGVLLLGQYSKEHLESWLKEKASKSKEKMLPDLLVIYGPNNDRYYVLKERLLPLCAKLLAEGRVKLKEEILRHWRRVLLEYQTITPMDSNTEFERYIVKLTKKLCPILATILEDSKLFLVYQELEHSQAAVVASTARIFNKGELLEYSDLFLLSRKESLTDTRLVLPFWYSLPVITSIIGFFKKLLREKKTTKFNTDAEEEEHDEKEQGGTIRDAVDELELTMVPGDYTLDTYLEELESRWSRLIDRKARENLISDVKSLIRDHLRQNLKLQKHARMTRERINQMAVAIVMNTPSLASLSGKDSLILYSELYLVKLLRNMK